MKKVLYGLLGLVVLLVAAAFIVPALIDVNSYKATIQQKAREATGRDLTIDGDIKLALLPTPHLSASGVHFANLPGSADKDMAQLKSLEVSVALLPLVSGNVEVTQVTLVGPVVVLETLPDGRNNWELGGAKPQGGIAGAATGAPEAKQGGASGISVKDLVIEDGTLIWRDARSGRAVRLDAVNGRLSADSLNGPFSGKLTLKAGQVPVDFEARIGGLEQATTPLNVVFKTEGGTIALDGQGRDLRGDGAAFDGSLKASGDSLAALAQSLAALAGAQPPGLPPAMAQKFALDTKVAGSRQKVSLSGLKLDLGPDSGSGDVTVQMGPPLRADLKLAFAKLDLDKLMAGAKPASPPPAAPSAAPGSKAPPAAPVQNAGLPTDIEGSLDLSVGTILYQGKSAQNVVLKGDLSKGTLTIANIGGQFPGDTTVTASGSVSSGAAGGKGQPGGSGKVEMRSAHLREFLGWLNVDTTQVPSDRLNGFAFTGQIAATPQGDVQIANAVVQLDGTTAKGAVTFKTAPKPSVIADLDVDTLNVDAYTGGARAAAPAARPDQKTAPAAGGPGLPFDATVKARVAHLIVQGKQIDGVDVDVSLAPDKLTFRPSRVANVAGASAKWSGSVAGYAGATPTVDLTLDLQAPDTDRLLQFAGVASPLKGRKLGALSVSGRIAGKSDDLSFTNFAVAAQGASLRLTGKLALAAAGPSYDFSRLELKADDGDRFLSLLGIASPVPGQKMGAISVTGAARGSLDQATVDLDGTALSGSLDLKGSVAGLRSNPTLAMDVGLDHPSFTQLMRLVSPGFNGGQNVGGVKLQMRLDGSPGKELRITNMRGSLGGMAVSGTVTVNLATSVPSIVANLETGELDLDKLVLSQKAELPRFYPAIVLPARFGETEVAQNNAKKPSGGKGVPPAPTPRPTASRGGHFSSQPIDVSSLRSIDGRIDMKSAALVAAPWRVDNAVVSLELKGGVLDLSRVTGRAFDGDFSLTGNLNAARLPARLDVKFNVARLDLGRLSRAIHHKDRFDGRINVDFALSGSGSSESELVGSLNGGGKVDGTIQVNAKVQEMLLGTVAGVAGKSIDKYLGQITGNKSFDTGGDLNAAITVALQRFANRENPISGTIAVKNGMASSNNLRITGNRARADTNFVASLPAWTLDSTTEVFLDENPSQSYLIVREKGPLDDPSVSVDRNPKYAGSNPNQPQQQQNPSQPSDQPQQQPQQKPKKISPLDLFKKK